MDSNRHHHHELAGTTREPNTAAQAIHQWKPGFRRHGTLTRDRRQTELPWNPRVKKVPPAPHQSPCPGCQNLVPPHPPSSPPPKLMDAPPPYPPHIRHLMHMNVARINLPTDHPHYRRHHFAIIVINLHITWTIHLSGHVHMNGSSGHLHSGFWAVQRYSDQCCTSILLYTLKNPSCVTLTDTTEHHWSQGALPQQWPL